MAELAAQGEEKDNKLSRLKNRVSLLKESNAEKDEALSELTDEFEAMEANLDDVVNGNEALERKQSELLEQNDSLKNELHALSERASELGEQNTSLQTMGHKLEGFIATLGGEKAKLDSIVASQKEALDNAAAQLSIERAQKDMLRKTKANLEAESVEAKKNSILEIATLRQKLSDEAGVNTDLRDDMDGLRKELCEAEMVNTKLSVVEGQLANAEQTVDLMSKERLELAENLDKAQKANDELQNQNQEREQTATQALDNAAAQLSVERAHKDALLKVKANLEAELEDAKKNSILEIATLRQKLTDEAGVNTDLRDEMDGLRKALCEAEMVNTKLLVVEGQLANMKRTVDLMSKDRLELADNLDKAQKANGDLQKQQQEREQTANNALAESEKKNAKLDLDSKRLRNMLRDTEKALVLLSKERNYFEGKHKSDRNVKVTLTLEKENLASEMARAERRHQCENRELTARTEELEAMLVEALQRLQGRFGKNTDKEILAKLMRVENSVARERSKGVGCAIMTKASAESTASAPTPRISGSGGAARRRVSGEVGNEVKVDRRTDAQVIVRE